MPNNLGEWIHRLEKDQRLIQLEFGFTSKLCLRGWSRVGDFHRRGRCNLILDFGEKKLLYKPRCLKSARAYMGFVQWMNRNGGMDPYSMVSTGFFLWMAMVGKSLCSLLHVKSRQRWNVSIES